MTLMARAVRRMCKRRHRVDYGAHNARGSASDTLRERQYPLLERCILASKALVRHWAMNFRYYLLFAFHLFLVDCLWRCMENWCVILYSTQMDALHPSHPTGPSPHSNNVGEEEKRRNENTFSVNTAVTEYDLILMEATTTWQSRDQNEKCAVSESLREFRISTEMHLWNRSFWRSRARTVKITPNRLFRFALNSVKVNDTDRQRRSEWANERMKWMNGSEVCHSRCLLCAFHLLMHFLWAGTYLARPWSMRHTHTRSECNKNTTRMHKRISALHSSPHHCDLIDSSPLSAHMSHSPNIEIVFVFLHFKLLWLLDIGSVAFFSNGFVMHCHSFLYQTWSECKMYGWCSIIYYCILGFVRPGKSRQNVIEEREYDISKAIAVAATRFLAVVEVFKREIIDCS